MKGKNLVCYSMLTLLLASGSASGLGGGMAAYAQDAAQQASQWKDRAEYDAFMAILGAQGKENNQLVELADKYLAAYPESKVLKEVYSLKLAGYQGLNNTAKMEETANKLLEINPGNLRALLLLSYLFPRTINTADPDMETKLEKAGANATKALEALDALKPPPGVPEDQFLKQREQSAAVLHQTAGFVALQKKDYSTAQQELMKSSTASPNDALGF